MILVCPSCDTRYFADDSAVGKEGRRVRCASCGHSWFAKVQDDGDVATADDTGLTREQVERLRQTAAANSASRSGPHSEYRAREHAKRKRNRLMAAGMGWAGGFLLFASAAGAAVVLRNQVVEAFPRTASIYRTVGLDVNRFGVELVNVAAKRSFDGTTPVLTVTGSAVNKGKTRRTSPQVRVSLRDEKGKEIHSWSDGLGVPFIGAGETVPFTSRIVAPPLETWRLAVSFADASGAGSEQATAVGHDQIQPAEKKPEAAPPSAPLIGDPPAAASMKADENPPWGSGDGPEEAAPAAVVPKPAAAQQTAQESGHH
jgi:predicted Zn finger-like uncharacterized protein